MKKTTYFILAIALLAVIINLIITDFTKFWEVNSLFRFSIPLITVIVTIIMIRSERRKRRNTNS